MTDPRQRLYRPVLGERANRPRPVVGRLAERDQEIERKELVGRHREPVQYTVKESGRKVEAAPNAPQLIRLVRHPFPLQPSGAQRQRAADRAMLQPRERPDLRAELRAAAQEGRRLPFPRATDSHPPVERPPIPSITEWLATAGSRGTGGRQ